MVDAAAATRAAQRVDFQRLRRDKEYLLDVVCQNLQQVDTYRRGLVTTTNFDKVLQALGLRHGQPEVDTILRYCTVVDDGYVHFKDLQSLIAPAMPRAKQSSAKGAIYPADEDARASEAPSEFEHPDARQGFLAGLQEPIRKVYARWERGQLSNDGFKAELRGLGVAPTAELERLLVTFGPSRAMPFGKLMYALQVDENDGRRARCRQDDAGSWLQSAGFDGDNLRQAICDFVDGRIPAVTFRERFRRHGAAPMTSELDRLVRMHESDNSVRFQDFARVVLRQEPKRAQPTASDTSAPGGGYLVSTSPASAASTSARSHGNDYERRLWPLGDPMVSRMSPSPYATGGDWSTSLDDTASDAAGEAGRRERRVETSSVHDSCYASVTPPFATLQSSGASDTGAWPHSVMKLSKASGSSRAQGHSGDIIGWSGRDEASVPPSPSSTAPSTAPRQDFLQWAPTVSGGRPEEEPAARPGKRFYPNAPSAGELAPFGRACDIGRKGNGVGPLATPFGTDQDMRFRRPEDAGTDEYRAALRSAGRVHR